MEKEKLGVIEGSIDSLDKGVISGWAWNPLEPDTPVELELLANQRLVTCFVADQRRQDLELAGKGNGLCAFSFELPAELQDGVERELCVQVRDRSQLIPNGKVVWRAAATGHQGYIETIQGSALVGWARDWSSDSPVAIQLFDGPRLIASGMADESRKDVVGKHGFRIPLPPDLMDGRPHTFLAREAESGALIATAAFVTPRISTPWSAIQKFAGKSLREYLAPVAAFRYESLARQTEMLMHKAVEVEQQADSAGSKRIVSHIHTLGLVHAILKGGFENRSQFPALAFEQVEQPDVSIVIPVHNVFPVTYNCLASLLLAPNRATFEVILVDDGSDDETTGVEKIVSGINVIRNPQSQGFVGSCNIGAAAASGNYLVLLNNDTEVTAGWLDELIWPFENFDRVGLTGSMLLFPDGRLQEAGGIVWKTGDPANYGRSGNPNDPRFHYTRQVDYVSGASIMLHKALWDRLGGFDPDFAPAYFEDTDLAFRVREQGLKTIYTPFSKVVHYEGLSHGTDTQAGIKQYQEINRPRFKAKWADACRQNGEKGKDSERVKDRNVNHRVLMIDAETPRPDINAGSYAAIQEIHLLQSLGFKVTFAPDDLAYMGVYSDALQRMGVECVYEPYLLSIGELLSKRGGEFDLVYITRYYIAEKVIELVRRFAPQAKILFNNADLHFLRELRLGLSKRDDDQINRAIAIRDAELKVMREVDLVLSYNEVEHAVILSHNMDQTRIAKCPWVVEASADPPPFDARQDIAFLGGFRHLPNVEAVEYFVREVMPLLRKRLPGVRLRVFGSEAEGCFEGLPLGDDVVIEGWVEDVSQVYDHCRIFIAPLLSGAGIKGKVLAALAHGVPCVLSPVAAEGFTGMNEQVALIASDAQAWVESIVNLHQNQAAWGRLSRGAIEYAANNYSFDQGRALMKSALQAVDLYPAEENQCLYVRQGKG